MFYAWLCRKPISEDTIACNVLHHGTGVINIGTTRIRSGDETLGEKPVYQPNMKNQVYNHGFGGGDWVNTHGRWPANVILTYSIASQLDFQSGTLKSAMTKKAVVTENMSVFVNHTISGPSNQYGDSGGASRFFKQIKG